MPRPLFSNIFTAYSLMSAYGWKVSIVATTTTSPLACCSERISASRAASLSASITLAKSLTGFVSSGGAGCASAIVARQTTRASETPIPRTARFLMTGGLVRVPGVDGACELLDRSEVNGKQPRRVGLRNRCRAFEGEHVGDDALGKTRDAGALQGCFHSAGGIDAGQPRNVPQQRPERRCRRLDEFRNRRGMAAGFHI